MEIVPMCLYKINEQQDFLTYPTVFRIDDSTQYLCKVRENMEYVRNFYVISPDFRPIPIGTKLYCAINSYESTLQIKQVYDVFNDKTLISKNRKKAVEVASLTKIMTCYVAINLIERLKLDAKLLIKTISREAC